MTLVVLLVAIAIATCFAALEWRRTSRALYAAAFALFLAVGCGPVPAWLLTNLQSAYAVHPTVQWSKRNAIVVLGAGTQKIPRAGVVEPGIFSYSRIVEAAALYRDCRMTGADCKVIVSGGDPRHNGESEASVYRAALLRLGVKSADVLSEPDSMNTWQNAQFTRALLQRYQPDEILLVSSAIHLKRSTLYFSHFGVDAIPVRADYLRAVLSPLPLSYNFVLADIALHEYAGIARYTLYNMLGLNAA
ncbi:YdcF family protein [Paraburkholderia sp. J8-2]|uniref:YdcF family protein n=1 Tax=Paraburkholderia sp. J8-2 TaxID=2805440 RepID=UPI002AB73636|nr:YdcF family protein [Paraburkholderia sp. J8-2]